MCVWDGVWLAWTGGKGILGLSSDLWAEKASCMLEEPCLQTFPVLASQVLEWVPFPPIPLLWAKVESPSGFLAEQPSEMASHILPEHGLGHQHGNSWLTLHAQQAANIWGWHVPFLPSCCLFSFSSPISKQNKSWWAYFLRSRYASPPWGFLTSSNAR